MKELLIVFAKNPVEGKVKKRLAATMGNERALSVYLFLLHYTRNVASTLSCNKAVFYSDQIDAGDEWSKAGFMQFVQQGDDLGERMENAFSMAFEKGYERVAIIGSDCAELTAQVIEKAFAELKQKDIAIGPAKDGGYYLLGMNQLHHELFRNKKWSSSSIFVDTLKDILHLNLSHKELVTLSDIDEEKDLVALVQGAM